MQEVFGSALEAKAQMLGLWDRVGNGVMERVWVGGTWGSQSLHGRSVFKVLSVLSH